MRILARYSARMAAGDYAAVYDVLAPDFTSHVTERVSPDVVGSDLRPPEQKFWELAKRALPDMRFVVGHWGGPHCPYGIGLSPARSPHAPTTGPVAEQRAS